MNVQGRPISVPPTASLVAPKFRCQALSVADCRSLNPTVHAALAQDSWWHTTHCPATRGTNTVFMSLLFCLSRHTFGCKRRLLSFLFDRMTPSPSTFIFTTEPGPLRHSVATQFPHTDKALVFQICTRHISATSE